VVGTSEAQICGSDLRAMDPGTELGFKFRNKFYRLSLFSFVSPPSRILALHRINYVMSKSLDIQNKRNSYNPKTLSNYIA